MAANLARQYRQVLKQYLAEGGEAPLHQAYELGRQALASSIGLLGLVNIHYSASCSLLKENQGDAVSCLRATGHFLLESLSPFEMMQLGNQESNAALRRLNEILEEEARRIAHTLHDEAAQLLATAYLELAEIQRESPPAPVAARVDRLKSHLDQMREQLRQLSHELRSPVLDQLGLLPALQFLAEGFQKRTGLKVTIHDSSAHEERFNRQIETALYRAVQEALNNVARHAHATHVEIRLWTEGRAVCCGICDDGIGFTLPAAGTAARGLGLLGIQERIGSLYGSFNVNSVPGAGAELLISIPAGSDP